MHYSKHHNVQRRKPSEILTYFIELLSNPGDTVLDTFAGSGSTGVAAELAGRNTVLIERDTAMYKKAEQHIKTMTTSTIVFNNLFTPGL